jgi:hypothetical protein
MDNKVLIDMFGINVHEAARQSSLYILVKADEVPVSVSAAYMTPISSRQIDTQLALNHQASGVIHAAKSTGVISPKEANKMVTTASDTLVALGSRLTTKTAVALEIKRLNNKPVFAVHTRSRVSTPSV